MTIYQLNFEGNKKHHTSIFTDNTTPDNLQIDDNSQSRLKLTNETMHEFIMRLLNYDYPNLPISMKNSLKKLIKKTDIEEKNFVAGIDTIDEKPHELLVIN